MNYAQFYNMFNKFLQNQRTFFLILEHSDINIYQTLKTGGNFND